MTIPEVHHTSKPGVTSGCTAICLMVSALGCLGSLGMADDTLA